METLLFPGWAMPDSFYASFDARIVDNAFLPEPSARFRIIGHSLGAFRACAFAAAHAASVGHLVLYAPALSFLKTSGNPAGHDPRGLHRMIAQIDRAPEAVLRAFFRTCFAPEAVSDITYPDTGGDMLKSGLCELREADLAPLIPILKTFSCAVVYGTADQVIPSAMSEAFIAALNVPDSCVTRVPGGSHLSILRA